MAIAEIKRKIQEVLDPILERKGAFLVDLQIHQERGQRVVQVFVDTDQGIKIEECAEISRELSLVLESGSAIDGPYELEISSPGIDRPLRLLRQYQKNVGRRFTIRVKHPDRPGEMKATLLSVRGEQLSFQPDDGEVITLDFSDIIESKEELPW